MNIPKLITLVTSTSVIVATLAVTTLNQAQAHCEIPCGIYSDDTVFTDLYTDLSTIEKSMKEINELSKDPSKNANQLSRWIANKDVHATKIQEVVSQYFLTQRIKPSESNTNKDAYITKLTQLHHMTVLAMKCKQTTDLKNVTDLKTAIDAFKASYTKK